MATESHILWILIPALLLVLAAAGVAVWALWVRRRALPEIPEPGEDGLVRHLDVAYVGEEGAHPVRHRLDVFAPAGGRRLPVLVFVHGGGWSMGHKSSGTLGMYDKTGETLARLGFVVVMPNYRLTPWVRHPEHIRDVARAFMWARTHAARYGGDPGCTFVGGHSAGGHLAALLATDSSYLEALGGGARDVRGCVVVSGVFRIGDFVERFARIPVLRYLESMGPAFGMDPEIRRAASPLSHVAASMPPFLVVYGDGEWYGLDRQAEEFVAAARGAGGRVESLRLERRNHVTIMSRARHAGDPLVQAIAAFVGRWAKEKGPRFRAGPA